MNRNSYMALRQNSEFWRRKHGISSKRKKLFSLKQISAFLFLILFIGLFSYGWIKFKDFASEWDFLKIKNVKVHAITQEMKDEIEKKIESNVFGSIISADTEKIKESIMRNSNVKDVKIKKILPSTIEIFIEEREGIAIGEDSKFYIIDENGEIVKETEEMGSLPLIKGVSLKNKIALEIAISFIKEMKNRGYDKYLEEVDVSNPFNMKVKIKDSSVKVYLGESNFIDKFERFLAIEKVLKEKFGEIEYIGFYDRERVYIKVSGLKEDSPIPGFSKEDKTGI